MTEAHTGPASLHDTPAHGAGPRSAGQMLRALRESAGVDPALLASAMKVSPQKLDALENDRLDELPDVTFARALASAICRAFGTDPAPVLERMPVSAPGLRPVAQAPINEPFRRSSDGPATVLTGGLSKPLAIGVIALLLGAAALWLLPTLPIQLNAPAPASEPAATDGVVRESVMPPAATSAEPPAPPAPAELSASAAAAEQAPPPAAAAPAAASTDLLYFSAQAETWVTVRDASGKNLINRALNAGDSVGVSGEPPLAVTIGRKDAVEVRVRGEPFDHRSISKTPVSRFEVR